MTPGASGVWEHAASGDLHGAWYDYAVYGPDGPGSHFTNQTGEHVTDPYALVSDDSWGRARVWRDEFAPPAGPSAAGVPRWKTWSPTRSTFRISPTSFPYRLKSARSKPSPRPDLSTAVENLWALTIWKHWGSTPSTSCRCRSSCTTRTASGARPSPTIRSCKSRASPTRTTSGATARRTPSPSRAASGPPATSPGCERQRLRDLVDALHARGMAVLIDVVFNHTGENMEGQQQQLTFNGIDKWYYYRLDENGEHIGAFGNEVKSENRPMTQRWLLDQLRHFVDVFGVDGFRIDLAGQTDQQTLEWIQAELGEDVLIYGEPWIGSSRPRLRGQPRLGLVQGRLAHHLLPGRRPQRLQGADLGPDARGEPRAASPAAILWRARPPCAPSPTTSPMRPRRSGASTTSTSTTTGRWPISSRAAPLATAPGMGERASARPRCASRRRCC